MIPISYNLRSLMRRWRTTSATALGIALVVFVLSTSMMLSRGIQAAMALSGRADVAVVLRKGTTSELGSSVPAVQVGKIVSGPGVKRNAAGNPLAIAESIIVVAAPREDASGQIGNVQMRGVPSHVLEFRDDVRLIEGRLPKPGGDEVLVGKRLRGRFAGFDLGKEFELKKNRTAQVVGIFEAGGSMYESEVWADLDTLRNSFGRAGLVSSVRLKLEAPERFETLRDSIEQDRTLGLAVYRESRFLELQSEGTAIFVTALASVVALFFSVGAILGAMITMLTAVAQRRRELGVLRALGFSPFSILASFVLESLLLALIGGLIGGAAALAMGGVEFSTLNFATWSLIVFKFSPSTEILATSLFFAALMGALGGLLPALQAARLSPVEAMRR